MLATRAKKSFLWAFVVLSASLGAIAGGGCTQKGDVVTVVEPRFDPKFLDCSFDPLPESGVPRRIISLIPSVTEWLFALGLGDRVIGVDRWADFPPEVDRLPRLGDLNSVSTEKILDAKPDLVFLFERQRDSGKVLEAAGLRVVIPPTEDKNEIRPGVLAVAKAAGIEARAEKYLAAIDREIARIRESRSAGKKSPRVLVVFERWPTLSVATGSSFIHRMIEEAGGVNVSKDADQDRHFVYWSLEKVLDAHPDVVIDLSAGVAEKKDLDEIAAMWTSKYPAAVRVIIAPSPVLARPGPRMAGSIEYLSGLIHGR